MNRKQRKTKKKEINTSTMENLKERSILTQIYYVTSMSLYLLQ